MIKLKKWPKNGTRVPEMENSTTERALWYNGKIKKYDVFWDGGINGRLAYNALVNSINEDKLMAPYRLYTAAVNCAYILIALFIGSFAASVTIFGAHYLTLLTLCTSAGICGFLAGLPVNMPEKEVWEKDSKF